MLCLSGVHEINYLNMSKEAEGLEFLTIDNLNFCYPSSSWGGLRVNHLSFKRSSVIVLLGPSGSGKTTFLKLIAGLFQPNKGVVWKPANSNISMTFQDSALLEWKSILNNVLLINKLGVRGAKKVDIPLAEYWLRELGLGDVIDSMPSQLSGGMRQRVSLARSLFSEPSLLLMDEPISSLDYHLKGRILKILDEYVSSKDALIILATHDIDNAVRIADEILLLGGDPAEVIYQHRFETTRAERILGKKGPMKEALSVRQTLIEMGPSK